MKEITINIDKSKVYDEVAKLTAYVGAKFVGEDDGVYDRISTTDENAELLDTFWNESRDTATTTLRRIFDSDAEQGDIYSMKIKLADSFHDPLAENIKSSLFSFFATSITAKWFAIVNKDEAALYAERAATCLESVLRNAFFRKRPTRGVLESDKTTQS